MTRPFVHIRVVLKWLAILLPLSVAVGSASAFFIWSLDAVTGLRFARPWLLWGLPFAGLGIGWIYQKYGGAAAAGNNLLIDEIHQPGAGVPKRLAPLILLGTLATHLFGGSAGREGTAVQMGGGIAATFARMLKLDAAGTRVLLMAGVAAGFGSVFGTPVAGAVFALEVLVVGRMQYDGLAPCFLAAVIADWTCQAWGIGHTAYQVRLPAAGVYPDPLMLGKVLLAALAFGLAAGLFSKLSHGIATGFKWLVPRPPLRPFIGGTIVIALFFIARTPDYLGLGTWSDRPGAITLPAMFTAGDIPASSWLWKLAFTVVTLGSGFKGGEVTPLFFIGAGLGNAIAGPLGVPVDLFAALGFVGVFAGATKTPLASTLLGMELFGAGNGIYLATACIVAYAASGRTGIYAAQRPAIRG